MSKKNLLKNVLNVLKIVAFFLIPAFMLTACTSKEELAFELEEQGKTQEVEYIPDAGKQSDVEAALDEEKTAVEEATPTKEPAVIYVHICGAVLNPGVYELNEGSRVFEGIEAAGGFCEDACEDYVNQAEPLRDGQRLIIPTLEEVETLAKDGASKEPWKAHAIEAEQSAVAEQSTAAEAASTGNADGLVNINTADESELSAIDGIGAGKAAAIVKYRQENGSFQSIQDIMKVSGIKEGTYEKIKDKITVK